MTTTSGPWTARFDRSGTCYIECRNGTVCEMEISWKPDADLIAAAPDLFEALKSLAEFIKDQDGGDQTTETGWRSEEYLDAWLVARAALAKAGGAS